MSVRGGYVTGVRAGVSLAVFAAAAVFLGARIFVDEVAALRIEHFALMVLALGVLVWSAAAVWWRSRQT